MFNMNVQHNKSQCCPPFGKVKKKVQVLNVDGKSAIKKLSLQSYSINQLR